MPIIHSYDFTGLDGAAWDPAKFDVLLSATDPNLLAEIRNNQGRILLPGTWEYVDATAVGSSAANVDILYKFRATASMYHSTYFRESTVDYSRYRLELYTGSKNTITLFRYAADNTRTLLDQIDNLVTYTASTTVWIRIQAIHDTIRLKMWEDGTPEPTAWNFTFVDPTPRLDAGVVSIRPNAGALVEIHIDDFSVNEVSDAQAPTITIDTIHGDSRMDDIYDSAGYDASTDTLAVAGLATDDIGVTKVEVLRGAGGVANAATLESPGTVSTVWSYVFDVSAWRQGKHTIIARSYDNAGNVTEAQRDIWHSPSGSYGAPAGANTHFSPLSVEGG